MTGLEARVVLESPISLKAELTCEPGKMLAIVGPSGSGKTSLLRVLAGLIPSQDSQITLNGKALHDLAPQQRRIGMVFQQYALMPHLTAMENVALNPSVTNAREVLEKVGLADHWHKRPGALSGGQQQRVALARALVVEPQLLLLDEPLGALDLKLRRQMQDELKALQQRVGTAFVHVTHDQEEAMALADHIVVMNQGRIEDQGPPVRVYARPATQFAASFMGESTIVPASSALAARLGGGAKAIRPEHITLSMGNLGQAKVETVTYQGSFQRIRARSLEDESLVILIRADAEASAPVGAVLELSVDPRHVIGLKS